jgi:hypothetical protein
MLVPAKPLTPFLSTWIALLAVSVALGKEFAVRPVTEFGGQPISSSAIPIAVTGDRLMLSAREDNQPRIYSTDGNSLQTISQTVSILNSFTGFETARLGGSVYFPGQSTLSTVGLYATDGTSVREVRGVLSSAPYDFELLNGNLVFAGASSQLYGSNGTTVRGLGISKSVFANTANFNNRLLFAGYPVGGGSVFAYSTDGQSLATIVTTGGQSLSGPQLFTELDGNAYFVAGGLTSPAIYRTNDGLVAEELAAFQDFTFTNVAQSMFALQGSLYVVVPDVLKSETVFYKSSGGLPNQVLTWQAPLTDTLPSGNGNSPLFIDEHRAYFQAGPGVNKVLYAFDGNSIDPIDLVGNFRDIEFVQLGNRTFLNVRGTFESIGLYELIDGNVVHLGPGLDRMTLFRGELFGVNDRLPTPFGPKTLYRTKNGQLVSMGEFGRGDTLTANSRFVEFNGQLYFNGQGSGSRPQLFAVVEVPEPTTLACIVAILLAIPGMRARATKIGQ